MADLEVSVNINATKSSAKNFAEQIASDLQKSLGKMGMGKNISSAVSLAGPDASKGIMEVAGKIGIVAAGITAVVALLSQASPYLRGILSIFTRAMMIFFRPFGDFLAMLLRPLAVLLMRVAVAFLKATRPITKAMGEGAASVPQIKPDVGLGIIGDIINALLQLGGAIGGAIIGFLNIGKVIGDWLFTTFQKIGEAIGVGIADVVYTIGQSLGTAFAYVEYAIVQAWNWVKGIGQKIWTEILEPAWNFLKNVGQWIWEQILQPAWNWLKDVGIKIWDIISTPFKWLADQIQTVIGWFTNLFGGGTQKKGSFQTGTSFVSDTGLYQLHRGEQVVPKGQAGKSVFLQTTNNFNGNISQEVDIDSLARRAAKITETELKQRGVL
jgi:hypothetical protein